MLAVAIGCGGTRNSETYFDPTEHSSEVQANFDTFARRCSKCHSLARPLVAGVTEVTHWDHYVARMVRQPGSGITPRDVPEILAFLYYYTLEVRGLGEPDDAETLAAPEEARAPVAPAPPPAVPAPAPATPPPALSPPPPVQAAPPPASVVAPTTPAETTAAPPANSWPPPPGPVAPGVEGDTPSE